MDWRQTAWWADRGTKISKDNWRWRFDVVLSSFCIWWGNQPVGQIVCWLVSQSLIQKLIWSDPSRCETTKANHHHKLLMPPAIWFLSIKRDKSSDLQKRMFPFKNNRRTVKTNLVAYSALKIKAPPSDDQPKSLTLDKHNASSKRKSKPLFVQRRKEREREQRPRELKDERR